MRLAERPGRPIRIGGSSDGCRLRGGPSSARRPPGGVRPHRRRGSHQFIWSAFLGGEGEDAAIDLALDDDGRVTIAGYTASKRFPVTPRALLDAHQGGTYDLFVARLDPLQEDFDAQLVNSTFLGSGGDETHAGSDNGPRDESARYRTIHMAMGPDGTVVVTTGAMSPGLPTPVSSRRLSWPRMTLRLVGSPSVSTSGCAMRRGWKASASCPEG